jgi:hypothetical protein
MAAGSDPSRSNPSAAGFNSASDLGDSLGAHEEIKAAIKSNEKSNFMRVVFGVGEDNQKS